MKLTKKSTMTILITVWQTTSILIVGAKTTIKNNGNKNKGNCIDSNEVTTITIAVAKKTI